MPNCAYFVLIFVGSLLLWPTDVLGVASGKCASESDTCKPYFLLHNGLNQSYSAVIETNSTEFDLEIDPVKQHESGTQSVRL